LDVTSDASVTAAAKAVANKRRGAPLYAIVNNAGGATSGCGTASEFKSWVDLNLYGPKRVTEAFLPLLSSTGRVVMISSAAGPVYVSKCSEENKKKLIDPQVTWADIEAMVTQVFAVVDTVPEADESARDSAFKAAGLGSGYYGFSKAALNAYTQELARMHPSLRVNACTPGFIETDLTRQMAARHGKTPKEMGMKPPEAGALVALYLTLGDPPGNGRYYGSDAVRSPLDAYRGPGMPPYDPGYLVATCVVTPQGKPCAVGSVDSKCSGTIKLTRLSDEETQVEWSICGLSPGMHGLHIHEFADFSNGCISAGPHYNPFGKAHGAPSDNERHVGDLGNIIAGEDGVSTGVLIDKLIKLEGVYSVVGRSFMVHADPDDLGKGDNSDPHTKPPVNGKCSKVTGNAGMRIACGEIMLEGAL